jgi:hypothetical protein
VIKGDSWRIREWPRDVYPNDADKARYLIRSNLTSLNAARAVCRAGRELYVNGDRYRAWLESSERQLAVRGFDFNLRKQQHKE